MKFICTVHSFFEKRKEKKNWEKKISALFPVLYKNTISYINNTDRLIQFPLDVLKRNIYQYVSSVTISIGPMCVLLIYVVCRILYSERSTALIIKKSKKVYCLQHTFHVVRSPRKHDKCHPAENVCVQLCLLMCQQ